MDDRDEPPPEAVVSRSAGDAFVPRVIIELEHAEAISLGVFIEDAIDEETAWAANLDL